MKELSANQVLEIWEMLEGVIQSKRPMPIVGAYQLAAMFSDLGQKVGPIKQARDSLIRELGTTDPENPRTVRVMNGNLPVFHERWAPVGEQQIEVSVKPLKLSLFGNSEALLAHEILLLGDLIEDS